MAEAYKRLRTMLGILGIALSVLVIIFGQFGENDPEWWYSISAAFFSNAGPIFIAVMGSVGCFLLTYGGYSLLDKIVNRAAGALAVVIAFFPCSATHLERIGIMYLKKAVSNAIHCTAAGLFFALLGFNIIFLFTRGGMTPTKWKKWRNRVYYICGWGIVLFMLIQAISVIFSWPGWITVINETVMLWFFGIAWLVKGEAIKVLNDQIVLVKE
jgi:hypothetical protein